MKSTLRVFLISLFFACLIPVFPQTAQACANPERPDHSKIPGRQISTNDIHQSATGHIYFTAFTDLEQIILEHDGSDLSLVYDGDTPLIIERSLFLPDGSSLLVSHLVIPEDVSFHAGDSVQADILEVKGVFSFSIFLTIIDSLAVDGTIFAPEDGIISIFDGYRFTGRENILGTDYIILCDYETASPEECCRLIEDASAKPDKYMNRQITLTETEETPLVINRDLVIPTGVDVFINTDSFALANGCVLTVNGFLSLPDSRISGTVQNNGELYLVNSQLHFSDESCYRGTGRIILYFYDDTENCSDHIFGLDISKFRIHLSYPADFPYYELQIPPCLTHSYSEDYCSICGSERMLDAVSPLNGVCRIAGATRVETALGAADLLKETLQVEYFDNIIVANAKNFPDALAGTYLAASKNAPILLTMDGYHEQVAKYIYDNLSVLGNVYILGGFTAVPAYFTDLLDEALIVHERLAGIDRFDTNLQILNIVGMGAQPLLVCTAYGFSDSLSVSATGYPVLLVGDSLSDSQKAFLQNLNLNEVYIIGGTAAVSSRIEEEMSQYAASIKRLSGKDRHQTSVLVAMEFVNSPDSAVLAYSLNFPDGLSGGPLAYCLRAPMLLTMTDNYTCASYCAKYSIHDGCIMGSDELINDTTARKYFDAALITVR